MILQSAARGISALIFDMDGVILHSTPLHNRAWEIYLERHGIPPERVQKRMFGLRNDQIVRDFFGDALDDAEVHAHGEAKEELFRELMAPQLDKQIIAGVREFLARWSAYPMGLASNASRANIDFVLDRAGLREFFLTVIDGHQAARPKPYPDIYLRSAQLLGAPVEACVIFEDSLPGIEAAKASGARVVGLTTTLAQLPPVDLVARDFRDPALERWMDETAGGLS